MLEDKYLIKINEFIQDMPPLSVSVSRILELSKTPKVDAKMLNDVISVDPVLTGKVLKLVNSAYYSMPNHVTSLVRAIVILGINTIKNLIISTSVISAVNQRQNENSALNMTSFWRHSVGVGVLAKFLALKQNIDPKFVEEYFVAGLLHDLGKLPLDFVIADGYKDIIALSRKKKLPLYRLESRYLGINHSELGERIVDLWKLPVSLHETIIFHHNIESVQPQFRRLVSTVFIANNVFNKLFPGAGGDYAAIEDISKMLKITGLTEDDLEQVGFDVDTKIKQAEVFLNT
ncbi:MAG: HDOD domain-containing protein [Spirochaetales bacterium]|nr:HDOD domain-containing protein [Spirochaetales bacterium]